MTTLHFLNYNNYQNRVLKGEGLTSTDNYTIAKSYSGLNFNIRDGIDTVHYINDSTIDHFPYDYCLVTADDSKVIKTKWFVMDAVWNRKGQWKITLKRDVKADCYDMYKNREFYCTKGLPLNVNDMLLFNSEGRQYNQILQSRTALKQGSNTKRWIIGFVDKTWTGGTIVGGSIVKFQEYKDIPGYIPNLFDFIGKETELAGCPNLMKFYVVDNTDTGYLCWVHLPVTAGSSTIGALSFERLPLTLAELPQDYVKISSAFSEAEVLKLFGSNATNQKENAINVLRALDLQNSAALIQDDFSDTYNGKTAMIAKDNEGGVAYKTMSYSKSNEMLYAFGRSTEMIPQLFASSSVYVSSTSGFAVQCFTKGKRVTLSLSTPSEISIGMPTTNSANPYYIFYIEDSEGAREFATAFAAQYSGGNVLYDLQLFPYKPDQSGSGTTYASSDTGYTNSFTLYWASSDYKEGTCTHPAIKTYSTMSDYKVGSEQHMCRIIAPNGAGAWEFNPAAIGGVPANSIKYEFTLMPFNSYLHIFPTFGKLYGTVNKTAGSELGETRGMVSTGPWTLPYSTDNWSTYQLQQSAYMDSFSRQIDNMTLTQDVDRQMQGIRGLTGMVDAFATTTAKTGSPYAGLASMGGYGVGAVAEQMAGDILREENINYTRDQFYNNLRNIQAQARPLASTSSITIGNSWFPIVELYTATAQEETILKDDLKVHGWTMGFATTFATMKTRVGTESRYISGHLLQVENTDDMHIANVVMSELNKGVYIDHV